MLTKIYNIRCYPGAKYRIVWRLTITFTILSQLYALESALGGAHKSNFH